jgi:hypothetical protein
LAPSNHAQPSDCNSSYQDLGADGEQKVANRPPDEEIAKWRKWFAMESNNRGWELVELAQRTPAEAEEMVNAAHASALLWSKIGTDVNTARAHLLLGLVHGLAGDAALALRYAQASLDYFAVRECPDWEIAFAHAAMACAAHAAGDQGLHERHYREAAGQGEAIADPEDREIFMRTFRQIASV